MTIDPQVFGSVLARLDSQDRQLSRLERDVSDLNDKIDQLIQQGFQERQHHTRKPDWMELIVGAVLGAVAYFIGAKILGA